jgi:hypothetical protein
MNDAILRIDDFLRDKIENVVTVKEIIFDLEETKKEIKRLNELRKNISFHYEYQMTRIRET